MSPEDIRRRISPGIRRSSARRSTVRRLLLCGGIAGTLGLVPATGAAWARSQEPPPVRQLLGPGQQAPAMNARPTATDASPDSPWVPESQADDYDPHRDYFAGFDPMPYLSGQSVGNDADPDDPAESVGEDEGDENAGEEQDASEGQHASENQNASDEDSGAEQASGQPLERPQGAWTKPITSGEVTAAYGIPGDWIAGHHTGVDLAVPVGTPVRSVGSGVVKQAGNGGDYGKMVLIRMDDGRYTLFAHLSNVLVDPGERVSTGSLIGHSGNTGRSSGPHLHFEVRKTATYGSDIDPVSYLASKGVRL
ncbi:M23 family metallopeptidase [Streptomyces sp. NPDC051776]|uniref:M23 family metallopeptidase n=1 Tax=Streptomyces sp. NPDC051776 TaxID=3155414 RepID=UPI00341F8D2D